MSVRQSTNHSLVFEIEHPPAIVPFQRHFPPAQRHLRIRVERTDVRPGGRRILLRIGQACVVRIRCIARPGVIGQLRLVIPRWSYSTAHRSRVSGDGRRCSRFRHHPSGGLLRIGNGNRVGPMWRRESWRRSASCLIWNRPEGRIRLPNRGCCHPMCGLLNKGIGQWLSQTRRPTGPRFIHRRGQGFFGGDSAGRLL